MTRILLLMALLASSCSSKLHVGSKSFPESLVLGEMLTQLVATTGESVVHDRGLEGTQVCWRALERGSLDAYPDYTGTIAKVILAGEPAGSPSEMRKALAKHGIEMSAPLGFNNTYAIGVTEQVAARYKLTKISDLRHHPELRFGFTHEFLERGDGWPSLRRAYDLPQKSVQGLEHGLAYRALAAGSIDAMELYSTDAEIRYYDLVVLADDRQHFPRYDAVVLWRRDLRTRHPDVVTALRKLEGAIDAKTMVALNEKAKIDKLSEQRVAAGFLERKLGVHAPDDAESVWARIARETREHLFLVLVSLACAILVSIPLGILAAQRPRLGQVVLATVGVLQTIPSLAVLALMIPLFGHGTWPALAALFLYSLLPIVRNTHAGLVGIPSELRESADALGLTRRAQLIHVELPLAARSILAGIKTSAVINIGTATLGGFVGAGGYGQSIFIGLTLDDHARILAGAIPAALMALAAQAVFELAERRLVV